MGVETLLLVGGAALSGGSSILSGVAQAKAGYLNEAYAEIDANNTIADSIANAKLIRRQRDSVQSSARAAVAASGMDVNSRTARLIEQDIASRSDEDIYQTMVNGQQKAARYRHGGEADKQQGEDAAKAGTMQAGATFLNAYSSYRRGWK